MVRHPRCVFINYNWINELSNTTIWWLDLVPMHPNHPPYSTHTRSRTPIRPQPPSTIQKTHAKV